MLGAHILVFYPLENTALDYALEEWSFHQVIPPTFIEDVKSKLVEDWRGMNVKIYGSTVNGFGLKGDNCDVDVSFGLKEEKGTVEFTKMQQVKLLEGVMETMKGFFLSPQ